MNSREIATVHAHLKKEPEIRLNGEFLNSYQNIDAAYVIAAKINAAFAAESDRLGEVLNILQCMSDLSLLNNLPLSLHVRIDNILSTLPPKGTM